MSRMLILVLAAAAGAVAMAGDAKDNPDPLELFEQRIMPIFRSPDPSSCIQCHLAAVDLKEYILPSHEKTFASLRSQGLVDVDHPEKSKILELIQMGKKDADRGARLIHAKTRKAEYDAFAAWIKACCNDPELGSLPGPEAAVGPKRPDGVIRHARKSRVVDSFVRNVWSQRLRCFPCHTPHEIDRSNPKHRKPIERVARLKKDLGKEIAARMDIFRETPEATMQSLIDNSRNTPPGRPPLINIENPRRSLLVLKPTSRVPKKDANGNFEKPSYVAPMTHMGGLKMYVDDQSYKSFIAWISDYAKVVGDRYASVDELPADNWYATQHIIIVRPLPQDWSMSARVQFFVHAWDKKKRAWKPEPIAFTQGTMAKKKFMAGALFLLRPEGSRTKDWDPRNATLKPGKYLLKAYVDSKRRLADDPTALLGVDDFYGQAEIRTRWGIGFKQATRISGDQFK